MFSGRRKFLLIVLSTFVFTSALFSQYYDWRPLGTGNFNGTNGHVYALTSFQGKIIAAGGFSFAGGINVNNIAQWDPSAGTWSAMGSGFNDTVYALGIYNSQLYAAGRFTFSGAASLNRIAMWNGTNWLPLGSGLDGEGLAIYQFGTDLIAGGDFSSAGGITVNNVARWNGSSWFSMAGGVTGSGDRVFGFVWYNSNCIAVGRFEAAGGSPANNIASWNGSTWSALGQGTDDRIFAVTEYDGHIVVGGDFEMAGGIPAVNIAKWNGSAWSNIGSPTALDDNTVEALTVFNGDLIVGGGFHEVENMLYVDRIVRWNGSSWNRMSTGMNDRVKALYPYNNELFAGGEFTTAGGRYCNSTARWTNETLVHVTGNVKFVNTNIDVDTGTVKILRLDVNTREVIVVNQAPISNGLYDLPQVPRDSMLRVLAFPDDELDFVPTYYPSNIDWNSAVPIYTGNSLTNININVYPVTQQMLNPLAATIGGKVYLNIAPQIPPPANGFPFWSDGIVYIKQGDLYRRFAISNTTQSYISTALNPGTYTVYVSRLGYKTDSTVVSLGSTNLDSVNFHLDTMNYIGLHNITSRIPQNYNLKQNYPNPFNPATVISFDLPFDGFAELKVYDILGREVTVLVNENLRKGEYKYVYDAKGLPSGIYFYRLKTNEYIETKKMILIK